MRLKRRQIYIAGSALVLAVVAVVVFMLTSSANCPSVKSSYGLLHGHKVAAGTPGSSTVVVFSNHFTLTTNEAIAHYPTPPCRKNDLQSRPPGPGIAHPTTGK